MNILRNDDATTSESQTRNCYNDSSSKSAFGSRAVERASAANVKRQTAKKAYLIDL